MDLRSSDSTSHGRRGGREGATRSSSVKTWRSLEPSVSTWGFETLGIRRCSWTCPVRGSHHSHRRWSRLVGHAPQAEIQFGGFAALAHNALVNNAAMLRWRWGADCPMTVRVPLGARTRSGPYHANMIESWYANDRACGPGPKHPAAGLRHDVEASALLTLCSSSSTSGCTVFGGNRLGDVDQPARRDRCGQRRGRLRRTAPDRQEQRNPGRA